MSFELDYQVRKEYLEVHIKAKVEKGRELEEARQRWTLVVALCRQHQLSKILALLHYEGTYGFEEKFELIRSAPKVGWLHDLKLAAVLFSEEQYLSLLFAQTAMNEMGYEMQLFLSVRKARKWLLSS